MRMLAVSLLASSLLAATPSAAEGPLRVDITQGVGSAIPIAIPDTTGGKVAAAGDGVDIGEALARIMRDDISSTGMFRLIRASVPGSGTGGSALPLWQKEGAQALLIGNAAVSAAGVLSYSCTLYDVFASKVDISRTFTVPVQQWRRVAHKCADLAFKELTGFPGHFDTRIAFVAETGPKVGRTKQLATMDYDGANITYLTKGLTLVAAPRYAPDLKSIVYMTYQNRQSKLAVHDLESGRSRMIDLPRGMVFAPRISPDGQTLAFSLSSEGDIDIYKVNINGGPVTRLTATPGIDTSPSFSPDGTKIVFESTRSGSQQIYVMNVDGSNQTRISFGGGRYGSPTWSPLGDMIAYTRVAGDAFRIGVMRTDGSRERLLTDEWQDESPTWAPSGRAIAFLRTRKGDVLPELWTTDITGRVHRKIDIPVGGVDPAWSGIRP